MSTAQETPTLKLVHPTRPSEATAAGHRLGWISSQAQSTSFMPTVRRVIVEAATLEAPAGGERGREDLARRDARGEPPLEIGVAGGRILPTGPPT